MNIFRLLLLLLLGTIHSHASVNVIYLNADDLGVMDVGFMGSKIYNTPNLDRQSARDRDIERQAILESKGWTILRVWSVDFFSDPEGEYNLLKKEIDSLLEEKRAHVEEPTVELSEMPEEDSKDETNTSLVMF